MNSYGNLFYMIYNAFSLPHQRYDKVTIYQHKKACFSFQKKINIFLVKYLQTPYFMLYLSSINRSKKQHLFI